MTKNKTNIARKKKNSYTLNSFIVLPLLGAFLTQTQTTIIAIVALITVVAIVGVFIFAGLKKDKIESEQPKEKVIETKTKQESLVEQKEIVEQEQIEQPYQTESVEKEQEIEQNGDTQSTDIDEDEEEIKQIDSSANLVIIARYKKSFLARLIQSSDKTKEYYGAIKSAILCYKKTNSRISWNYDSVNSGKNKLVKFAIRGKTLSVYFAFSEQDEGASKTVRTDAKKFEGTSYRLKITSDRKLKTAIALIDSLVKKFGLEKLNKEQKVEVYPYESTQALIEKGLIKELISQEDYDEYLRRRAQTQIKTKQRKSVSASEVSSIISDKVASLSVIEKTKTLTFGKKAIVNVDVLSANYNAGETVTIQSLKEKKLIDKSATAIKLLARGVIDKPLFVKVNSFSVDAIKMIVLTGGTVEKV